MGLAKVKQPERPVLHRLPSETEKKIVHSNFSIDSAPENIFKKLNTSRRSWTFHFKLPSSRRQLATAEAQASLELLHNILAVGDSENRRRECLESIWQIYGPEKSLELMNHEFGLERSLKLLAPEAVRANGDATAFEQARQVIKELCHTYEADEGLVAFMIHQHLGTVLAFDVLEQIATTDKDPATYLLALSVAKAGIEDNQTGSTVGRIRIMADSVSLLRNHDSSTKTAAALFEEMGDMLMERQQLRAADMCYNAAYSLASSIEADVWAQGVRAEISEKWVPVKKRLGTIEKPE